MASKEVLINIKGDQKELDSAVKKSNNTLKTMGSEVKSMGVAFAAMASAGVAAFSAVSYAAWDVTKGMKDYGVQLDKVTKITGVSVDTISQMAYAAEQEHASLEDLQVGWRNLARVMSDTNDGSTEYQKTFEALGLSVVDSTGNLKSLEKITLEIADSFATLDDETKKTALAQDLFGRSGLNMVAFLNMGSEGIETLMQESVSLGNVWTDEMSQSAKLFDDKLTALNYTLKATKWQIGNALLPEFEKVTDWFLENKEWMLTTVKDIFKIDVGGFGDKAVEELDKIKEWTDNNKQALADTWFWIKEGVDATITSVKVLYMSLAELYAFKQYLMSGGTDESLKALQTTSHEVANMYKDIGQKPWSQAIVSTLTGNASASSVPYTKGMWGDARVYAPSGQPVYKDPLYDITRASYKLIQLKLDSSTTKDLMSGQTVTITANAAMTGT
jgi:hypothetical protein